MSTKRRESRGEGLGAFYRDVAASMFPDLTTAEGIKALQAIEPDPVAPSWSLLNLLAGKYTGEAPTISTAGLPSLPLAVRIKAYRLGKVYGPFAV